MKLTKYGKPQWLTATIVLLAVLLLSIPLFRYQPLAGGTLAVLAVVVWFAFVAFFRDPYRVIRADVTELVSAADGTVRDIELIPAASCENPALKELFGNQDILCIGIFLSVLDVHINRVPCDVRITHKAYKEGAFHDARDGRASKENESMLIGGIGKIGDKEFPIAVRQISGAIARRIVCPIEVGTELAKGEQYGMIKFGSRTEVYLPAKGGFTPLVSVGQKVAGGVTILAEFREKTDTTISNLPSDAA